MSSRRSVRAITITLSLLFAGALSALAGPPVVISHQGRLLDQNDAPVTGNVTLKFCLYTTPFGGIPIACETRTVSVTQGLYTANLDTLGNPALYSDDGGNNQNWFFGITVGADAELAPRLRVATTPFAAVSSEMDGTVDKDHNGTPDVGVEMSAKEPRAILKTYFETGDVPTQSQFYSILDATGATIHVQAKDQFGNTRSSSTQTLSPSSLSSVLAQDHDGDGHDDGSIESIITPTTCGVAINTKGTGADKGRVSSSATPDSVIQDLSYGPDGALFARARGIISVKGATGSGSMRMTSDPNMDGIPDGDFSAIVTPTTSNVAINTKGTGADKNRVMMSTSPDTASLSVSQTTSSVSGDKHKDWIILESVGRTSMVMSHDDNGDNDPESSIESAITPTTSSVAINTKGTGADKGRVSMSATPDTVRQSSEVTSSSVGGNHADGWNVLQADGTVEMVMSHDHDGDHDPESDITSRITPTKSSVAINVKGTGADRNRVISSSEPDSVKVELSGDIDGNGLPDAIAAMRVKGMNSNVRSTSLLGVDRTSSGTPDVLAETVVSSDTASSRLQGPPGGALVPNTISAIVTASGASMSVGAATCDGSTWTNASDKNLKENFTPVDGADILEKVAELPVTRWNYKNDDASITHIGPTAQDFQQAFGVGESDKTISTIDPSGIALVAVKELNRENAELRKSNARLEQLVRELARRLDKIEQTDRSPRK